MNIYESKASTADAIFFAVGLTVTILELGILASLPQVSIDILLYAVLIQISLGFLIETLAGVMRLGHDPFLSIRYGYLAKFGSIIFFGLAVYGFTTNIPAVLSWLFITLFYVLDSVGSGILQVTFRPGYSLWYKTLNNELENLSFLNIYKRKLFIRIGLPAGILFCCAILYIKTGGTGLLFLSTVIGCIIFIRTAQIFNYLMHDKIYFSTVIIYKIDIRIKIIFDFIKNQRVNHNNFLYSGANVIFILIMTYFTGVVFRISQYELIQESYDWLFGATFCILLHASVNLIFNKIDMRRINISSRIFYLSCGCICLGAVTIIVIHDFSFMLFFILFWVFCFLGLLTSNIIIRFSATEFGKEMDGGTANTFISELISNFLVTGIMIGHIVFFPDRDFLISALCGIVLAGLLMIFSMAFRRRCSIINSG